MFLHTFDTFQSAVGCSIKRDDDRLMTSMIGIFALFGGVISSPLWPCYQASYSAAGQKVFGSLVVDLSFTKPLDEEHTTKK